jgi:predicted dehydrogenase
VSEFARTEIALIGCGRWGSLILRDLVALGAEVTVVVPTRDKRDHIMEAGARRVVTRLSEVSEVNGIVIATPTSLHSDHLLEAIKFGVPVFCEKPLTNSVVTAHEVLQQGGDRIFVMDKWRYHPAIIKMAEIAREQTYGKVVSLDTVRTQWGNPHSDVDASWILLPHDLSIALEIFGEVPSATASSAIVIGNELKQLATQWNFSDDRTLTTVIGISSQSSTRQIAMFCEQGVVTLNGGWDEHLEVNFYNSSESGQQISTPGELPLLSELRAFLAYLNGGPAPKSNAQEAFAIVQGVESARKFAGLLS